MCWFKTKLFYVDISEDEMNYQHVTDMIKLHHAKIAMFMSKDVTHVIRIQRPPVNNLAIVNKMRYTRAGQMLQRSLQKSTPLTVSKHFSDPQPNIIISPSYLKKLSDECRYCDHNKQTSVTCADAEGVTKRASKVRRLNGQFLKVEDESGIYRPLIIEMSEWPEIYFDGPAPLSPFCNPKVQTTRNVKSLRTKRKFCELCNVHYSNYQDRVYGSQHQDNANNDGLFARLDALIAEGPTIYDFLKKKE